MRLVLVRHGATANNLAARLTGQSDVPLSSLGVRQAEALAEALAGAPCDALVASDLARARATAESLARRLGLPVTLDADLREIALGVWEGHTYADLREWDPASFAARKADPLGFAPPGGETLGAFAARLAAALDRWRARFPEGNVLWMTHGGVIGVLLCQLLGIELSRRWQLRRDNASISEVEIGSDYAILMRLNETSHLRALADDAARERYQVL